MVLAYVLTVILSLADFLSEGLLHPKQKYRERLLSFAAGVAVTYLLIKLLPEIYERVTNGGNILFFMILLGFLIIFLIERHLYKHKMKTRFKREHRIFHLSFFFIYNFLIGTLLVDFVNRGSEEALLFFVPFLLYTIVEILPREFKFEHKYQGILYSAAPIYGTILAMNVRFGALYYNTTLALITGALLYLILREAIPPEKQAHTKFYILGTVFYAAFILMTWLG